MKFGELFEAEATKAKAPMPEYVYKAVSKKDFGDVQSNGLTQKNRIRMTFHDDYRTAMKQEPGGVLLRVKRKGMPDTDSESEKGVHKTKGSISPGRAEIYHPYRGWKSVKKPR